MEEIMKKHEKAQAKIEHDDMAEVVEDAFIALQKKPSVVF
jgi:hypothetical protein